MDDFNQLLKRRTFLGNSGVSLGSMALASLLSQDKLAIGKEPAMKRLGIPDGVQGTLPHFAAKAKRVIFLYMSGALRI